MLSESDRCPHTKKAQSRRGCSLCFSEESTRIHAENYRLAEERARAAKAVHDAELQRRRDEAAKANTTADFTARNPTLEAHLRDEDASDRDLLAAHLVYADWLEEHGNPLADLIRMQVARAPTAELEQKLRLYPGLTGHVTEPVVRALGPVIEVDTVRDLEPIPRHALVEQMIESCYSMTGLGIHYVAPPAQAFQVEDLEVALSRGFATTMHVTIRSIDQWRRVLHAPFAAVVAELQIGFGHSLQDPNRLDDALAVLGTSPAAPRLRMLTIVREVERPLAFDRARLPGLTIHWAQR